MKVYIVDLSKAQLRHSSDMLRYDNAYRTERTEAGYRIYLASFTPARWHSFGFTPEAISLPCLSKDYNEAVQRSIGFTEGVRFAQEMLDAVLIQGR